MADPSVKAGRAGQKMWRNVTAARPRFDPIWTTPCVGISAAGGTSVAITASSSAPPPMPKATVMNDPTKLVASSAANTP